MSAPLEQTFSTPPPVQATYKSREVESLIDIYFYRPMGFQLALWLSRFRLTPTQVTALGAVFGLAAGHLYYYSSLPLNLLGVLLHVIANAFDNADGQLARMTGTGSRLGRMTDSFADHLIFINIYAHLAARCLLEGGGAWPVVLLALAAGASHAWQGAIADFVRNAYLYFTSRGGKGDFESVRVLRDELAELSWHHQPWHKLLLLMHVNFTRQQEILMPTLARLRDVVTDHYRTPPEWLSAAFRRKSEPLLPWVNLIMTNPRMILLLLVLVAGQPQWFFIAQLSLFNLFAAYLLVRVAQLCADLLAQLKASPPPQLA